MNSPACKEEKELRAVLAGYGGPLAIALSGGVDSRALAFCAVRAGLDVVAVHAFGPHIPAAETAYAEDFSWRARLPLLKLHFDPLGLPGVAGNGRMRCYHCKKALAGAMKKDLGDLRALAAALGLESAMLNGAGASPAMGLRGKDCGGRILCDGSNADDLKAHRPGMDALREEGVKSPLAEAGIGKAAIRRMAALAGMENPQQASRPCLLTRLAYGMRPQAEMLDRLADAEAELQDGLNIADLRLRLTPAPLLQCPKLSPDKRLLAREILARRGFGPAEIVEGDNISGFFD